MKKLYSFNETFSGKFFWTLNFGLLFFAFCCHLPLTSAQPGSLDTSFSSDGKVTTSIGSSYDQGHSVVIQNDGKIVVAGFSGDSNADFALARYNADGTLDSTFDSDGKLTTSIGSSTDHGYSVAIQSDGKILVAGYSAGFYAKFALVRYNTDGTLDSTFDSDGKVTTEVGSSTDNLGYSVAIQSDGKILVAGYTGDFPFYDIALSRYDSTGSLDSSFGSGGKVISDFGGFNDAGYSVHQQTDGKILVAGHISSLKRHLALVRYKSNGSLDSSFGSNGITTTDFGNTDDGGYSVAIQSDNKIVVAGYSDNASDFALVRYNTDGTLDSTFDSDGKVTTPIGSSYDEGKSVAIQSDGKIVVAGKSYNGADNDFALVRYNPDGSLDNTFDSDGKVTTPIGSSYDEGKSVVIQSDGKIVVAGFSTNGADSSYFAVVRYNAIAVPLSVSITNTSNEDGSCNGSATVTASGGISPYSYQWTTGDTTAAIDSLCAGTYTCTVTDGDGDTATVSVNILLVNIAKIGDEKVSVTVFPNPAKGEFSVQCKGMNGKCITGKIMVYNILGEMVYQSLVNDGQHMVRVDFFGQGSGIYYLQIVSEKGNSVPMKIVVH